MKLLALALFGLSTAAHGFYCEIYDTDENLVGVTTTTSGKVARYDSQSDRYRVEALAVGNNLAYLVYQRGGLVVSKMGRITPDGKIYDYPSSIVHGTNQPRKIGSLTAAGDILDRQGARVGTYKGCEHLDPERRVHLVGAAAARLMLFRFGYDRWYQLTYQSCSVDLCTW